MDKQVLERARQRVAEARTDGVAQARLDAALERARAEVMRLAHVADELELAAEAGRDRGTRRHRTGGRPGQP